MPTVLIDEPVPTWKTFDLLLFRFFFLYFIFHLLPLDREFWKHLGIMWQQPFQYAAIFNLANYIPHFFSKTITYVDWGLIVLLALASTVLWTKFENGRSRNYTALYYWLRVMLRYKLSSVLLTYGFLLLFTLWAPYPSISQLNTSYGDFTLWKLFVLSLGVSPSYQFFLGFVEVVTGLLLIFRKTVPLAALTALIFLGNIYVSNITYEGNLALYSLYLISIALFLLLYDIRHIIRLFILQQPTAPHSFKTAVLSRQQQRVKVGLKTCFLLFFVGVYGFNTGKAYYRQNSYRYPTTAGLTDLEGLYNVKEFRLNNTLLPYSDTDTIRWQNVVFEKWNTISIRTYARLAPYPDASEGYLNTVSENQYELAGSAGRFYYSYAADTLRHILTLYNRSSYYANKPLQLHYTLLPPARLLLYGTIDDKDSIMVILDKIDKKYLLQEAAKTGRRMTLKL